MNRSYTQWIHWLETRNMMPQIRPGIENTRLALEEAGILPLVCADKVIHIAGTNGKGTTAKTLEQLLLAQGKSVGLYTSPHLVETTERIRRNGKSISAQKMQTLCEKYQALIEKHNLSHFESLTLFSADLFFRESPVDYAIYEIGLGGTWDATNVIPHDTSVITTLGFDHMHILGNTLSEIADNKFGIIQKENSVYHFAYSPEIENQLAQKIKVQQAKEYKISPPEVLVQKGKPLPTYFLKWQGEEWPLSLPGLRAAENMWLALHVFAGLGFSLQEGFPVLKEIDWPARMSRLNKKTICPVYLSGDHNIQGLESLRRILLQADYENIKLVFGLSKNRDHKDFLQILEQIPRSEIFLTQPQFQGVKPIDSKYPYFAKVEEALDKALQNSTPNDLVVVTGSLYLCGDLLKTI